MISKKRYWTGIVVSALVFIFLTFDAVIHTLNLPVVQESFAQLGYPANVAMPLGIVELVCLMLYAIPRTRILGAILWTGFLGGAVATNVRVGAPLFGNILFPVYIGVFLWFGLFLFDKRVSALIPFRTKPTESDKSSL